MGIPIKRLLNQIDSEELSLYLAAERLAPMDDPWQRNALNCYVTAKAAGIKCKESDFIPRYEPKKQNEKLLQAALSGMAAKCAARKGG